jgi:hypothetical protein
VCRKTRRDQKSHKLRAKPTCPGAPWRDLQFYIPGHKFRYATRNFNEPLVRGNLAHT